MKNTIRIAFIVLLAVVCAMWLLLTATAQKRKNDFLHSSASHKKLACSSCHKSPTGNSEAVRGFPDVADYPDHDSCIRCHRSDMFIGNSPAICAICHTSPSPRSSARFPFPVKTRSHEFTAIFPHDVHQDIIARNEGQDRAKQNLFVRASFPMADPNIHLGALAYARATDTDDPPPTFNNCAICHQSASVLPKFGNRQGVRGQALADAAAETFTPGAGFFKTAPVGHASCFTCHYQDQKPIRTDCAGCHRPAAAYFESGVTMRYSLKFDHQSANHVNKDCTTCHVRITQNSDAAAMKDADVPFVTCASCHAPQLKEETEKRAATMDKPPVFQCVYCHSPEIGRFAIPASHRNR